MSDRGQNSTRGSPEDLLRALEDVQIYMRRDMPR